jgi:uncharacterized protein YndB with AHSA1/START domain
MMSEPRWARIREGQMSSEKKTHDVIVTRAFDAPRERLWRAWSEPDEVMRWWGPQGFTSPMCRMDFRTGGTTLVCMRSDQGWELFNTWSYRSIVPMERIEFVNGFADRDGKSVTPTELGLPSGIPREVLHVVTFSAIDGARAKLTVHEHGYPDAEIVEISRAGMEQCLDKMAISVARP